MTRLGLLSIVLSVAFIGAKSFALEAEVGKAPKAYKGTLNETFGRTEVHARFEGAIDKIEKSGKPAAEIRKEIEALHTALKASTAAKDPVLEKELQARFEEAFGPRSSPEARARYYRSGVDAMSRVKAVEVTAAGEIKFEAKDPVAEFFGKISAGKSATVPNERLAALGELAQMGDPEFAQAVLHVSSRADTKDANTAGNGTSNLRNLMYFTKSMMAGAQGSSYQITATNDAGEAVPTGHFETRFQGDSANAKSARGRAARLRQEGTVEGMIKKAAATGMTAPELNALMAQIGTVFKDLADADPTIADAALDTIRGLDHSFGQVNEGIREVAKARQKNNGKLADEVSTVKDEAGKDVELRVVDTLAPNEQQALKRALEGLDLEKMSMADMIDIVEKRLREKEGIKEEATIARIIDSLFRERGTKRVVDMIYKLEKEGKINPGDTEKFFCYKDPATGQFCLLGLNRGPGSLLASTFKATCGRAGGGGGVAGGPGAKPAGHTSPSSAPRETVPAGGAPSTF